MSNSVIKTKASMHINVENVQETVFTSYKSKTSRKIEENLNCDENEIDSGPIFQIKKARSEVIKFGLTNLKGDERKNAKLDLAIKLGAKPPRRRYRNYKELLKKRSEERVNEDSKNIRLNIGRKSISKAGYDKQMKNERKMKNKDLLDVYGKIHEK